MKHSFQCTVCQYNQHIGSAILIWMEHAAHCYRPLRGRGCGLYSSCKVYTDQLKSRPDYQHIYILWKHILMHCTTSFICSKAGFSCYYLLQAWARSHL